VTSPSHPLRIGTRGSALALAQAGLVRDALAGQDVEAALHVVTTEGDRRAPDTAWGEGAFVGAIESALLAGTIDVAVHSAKDVPTDEDPRLRIAAYLPRADPRDVLVLRAGGAIRSVDELPAGTRVGTDSPRRTAFLRAVCPDARFHPLHGNVDTRLRRLDDAETDALVLAAAGLARLGRADRITLALDPGLVPPAPGQGALAVQVRDGDAGTEGLVTRLDDAATRRAVEAERALLAASEGGCRSPIGALARFEQGEFELVAGYARSDGTVVARAVGRASGGSETDEDLVEATLASLAAAAAERGAALGFPEAIVARPEGQAAATMLAFVDAGFTPRSVPGIAIESLPDGPLAAMVGRLDSFDWVVLTSANAVRALRDAAAGPRSDLGALSRMASVRWAAVGRGTERALRAAGLRTVFRPSRARAMTLAEELPIAAGARVLLPRGDLADDEAPALLRTRGASVESVVAYRTIEAPAASLRLLAAALAGRPVAWVASSPSSVRGLLTLAGRLGPAERAALEALPVVAIGPASAGAARAFGLAVAEAAGPSPADVAAATARTCRSAVLETR
jgi:hydroxymethylbilane synthase